MTARGRFLYNSWSKSMEYETWLRRAISFTIPSQNHWNLSYDCYGPFPLQFLIKIIEIWPMTAMGNFHYNSLSKSLKYDLWLLWAISFTIPYQNHWNMTYDSYGAISITIPYQNHRNMTYDCYEPFPLQFLIKIIEIWPMTAMGHFHYNSLSKSLKYDLWLLWAIFFTSPYQNQWNMIPDC